MDERIDLIVEQKRRGGGVSVAVLVSLILHALGLTWIVLNYQPITQTAVSLPVPRYIQLIRQDPRQFTEAPGNKVDRAPMSAPLSNGNRNAATPHPTGEKPTSRPGENNGMYAPSNRAGDGRQRQMPQQQQQPQVPSAPTPQTQQAEAAPKTADTPTPESSSNFAYHPPTQRAPTNEAVDWRTAIRKVASLGEGQQGQDLGNAGGEKGFAENGQLSFESDWFPWGDYAESMVSRIRVNWYNIMPQLIQTGMKGVVTIRFTIHRNGTITDVTILNSSGVPPYDFAAKKAIELSSPLNPLPKAFPNETERVTAMFYYNMEVPKH